MSKQDEKKSPYEYAWPGMFGYGHTSQVTDVVTYDYYQTAITAAWPCPITAPIVRLVCQYITAHADAGRVTFEMWHYEKLSERCDLHCNWYGPRTYGTSGMIIGPNIWLHPSAGVALTEFDCGKPTNDIRLFTINKRTIRNAVRARCRRTRRGTNEPYSTDSKVVGQPFRMSLSEWEDASLFTPTIESEVKNYELPTDELAYYQRSIRRGQRCALQRLQNIFHARCSGESTPRASASFYMRTTDYEEPGRQLDQHYGPAVCILFDQRAVLEELRLVHEIALQVHGMRLDPFK